MIRMLLVRHGQSEDNVAGTTSDCWREPDLTSEGRADSRKFGERISRFNTRAVFSSPAIRSVSTAEEICRITKTQRFEDELLREVDVGRASGLPWSKAEPIIKEAWRAWSEGNIQRALGETGDSFDSVHRRIKNFANRLVSIVNDNDLVVVVVHGGFSNAVCAICSNMDFMHGHNNSLKNNGTASVAYDVKTEEFMCVEWGSLSKLESFANSGSLVA